MPIQYVLHENNLTSDPGDYAAMVQPSASAELEDVIERVIEGGSTISRPDIFGVLEDFVRAIENMVLEGTSVNTPLANFGASIKGVFDGQADSYDPNRHQVTATVTPGSRLRAAVRKRAQVVKGEAFKPRPNPLEYTDLNSGERNSVLTPGGLGQVIGHRLKFDPADANQGVFFVGDAGATRAEVVGRNKPGELMFLVPAGLASGEYTLQVRAVIYGGEEVRSGALAATLSVT
jgi:hypothetical protein